jgi:DNA-binding NtrC family response regulator
MSSTHPTGTILIVEDEVSYWAQYQRKLAPLGFRCETAINPQEVIAKLKQMTPDIILLDLHFDGGPPQEGLDLLSQIREQYKTIKVIVVTGGTERQVALEAVRRGAVDFIEKGSGFIDALQFRVQAVFERLQLERQIEAQREREIDRIGGYPYGAGQINVGTSPIMRHVYDLIERVARVDEIVLISGETGTGKELVSQAIHYHSQRKGRWIPLNCAAFPAELIEDELFGHRRGAFSGATGDRAGAFEAGESGTIFLDEIGEMPLSMQPRLLRVLQEKKIKRIGENQERPVNVRVIAATNRDLEAEVKSGNFREDLYYRLNALRIPLPPLRERGGDVPLLIRYFTGVLCQQYGVQRRFTPEAIERLSQHGWPGNLRELKDVIQRAILFADREEISAQALDFTATSEPSMPARELEGGGNPMSAGSVGTLPFLTLESEADVRPYKDVRKVFEAWYVDEVLRLTGGNQTRASHLLEIDRNSIRRILERGEGV